MLLANANPKICTYFETFLFSPYKLLEGCGFDLYNLQNKFPAFFKLRLPEYLFKRTHIFTRKDKKLALYTPLKGFCNSKTCDTYLFHLLTYQAPKHVINKIYKRTVLIVKNQTVCHLFKARMLGKSSNICLCYIYISTIRDLHVFKINTNLNSITFLWVLGTGVFNIHHILILILGPR